MMTDHSKTTHLILSSILLSSFLLLAACHRPATQSPLATGDELKAEQAFQQSMIDRYAEDGGAPRPWRNRKTMNKEFYAAAERVEKAGGELCKEIGLPEKNMRCFYYFDKTRSKELNAYADGEWIYITKGMLRFLKDEDEVALILSHELAHNLMAHSSDKQINAIAGGLVGVLLEGFAASRGYDAGGNLSGAGLAAGALSYSVSYEQEADYISMYIAARAGYDISKAPGIWRRFSVEEPDGIYESFTHPNNADRVVSLQKIIDEINIKQSAGAPLVPEFRLAAAD